MATMKRVNHTDNWDHVTIELANSDLLQFGVRVRDSDEKQNKIFESVKDYESLASIPFKVRNALSTAGVDCYQNLKLK